MIGYQPQDRQEGQDVPATTGKKRGPKPTKLALSPRQIEVTSWLYYGKTNEEIGLILHVDTLTVKNHVQSAIAKLDVLNRTRLVTRALELGLITMPPFPAATEKAPSAAAVLIGD